MVSVLYENHFFYTPPPTYFSDVGSETCPACFSMFQHEKENIYNSRKLFKESGHSKDRNVQQIFFLIYEHCTFWNKNSRFWHVKIQVEFANYFAVLSTQVTIWLCLKMKKKEFHWKVYRENNISIDTPGTGIY